jgi:hypothetical protein
MPLKRDPLKRLTSDERREIELIEARIARLALALGAKLCWCGRAAFDGEWCSECAPKA